MIYIDYYRFGSNKKDIYRLLYFLKFKTYMIYISIIIVLIAIRKKYYVTPKDENSTCKVLDIGNIIIFLCCLAPPIFLFKLCH